MRSRLNCARRSRNPEQRRFTSRCGPILALDDLIARLSAPRGKQSLANFLRKAAQLSPVAIGLLQEAAIASGKSLSSFAPPDLAQLINAVPIKLDGTAPIARAISTAGGTSLR